MFRVRSRSLKHRIVDQYSLIIFITVVLMIGLFLTTLHHYYYNSVEELLRDRMEAAQQVYRHQVDYPSFQEEGRILMNQITIDPIMEIQVIDREGNLLLSSSGFAVAEQIDSEDVKMARSGQQQMSLIQDSETGDKLMALAAPLVRGEEQLGVLRYVTVVTPIDLLFKQNVLWAALAGGLVVFFVLLFSLWLARSVIEPIKELTHVASQMAAGRYSLRATYPDDDELGELAHTLNQLSQGIVKSNQLKNDFISSISHELRTPLTSIKGWSETLLLGDLHRDVEEIRTGLDVIVKESNRLSGLVEELLDFSQLQAHRMEIEREEVDLLQLLFDLEQQFQARMKEQQLDWSVQVPTIIPPLLGDENRLKQVLINLVDNACKFTPAGGKITLQLDVKASSVVIQVEDSGCGIAASELPYVQEKFYKGEAKQAGSGLGLAISAEIIQLHGGELALASDGEHGTAVIVTLPLHKTTES